MYGELGCGLREILVKMYLAVDIELLAKDIKKDTLWLMQNSGNIDIYKYHEKAWQPAVTTVDLWGNNITCLNNDVNNTTRES